MLVDFVGTQKIAFPRVAAIPFTFPDSGISAGIYRVSPDTMTLIGQAIRKATPAPEPPTQEVEFADGKLRIEKNESDPEYLAARKKYEMTVVEEMADRLIRLVARRADVEVEPLVVAQFRADMAEIGVPVDEEDDKIVYFRHICISSERDYKALSDLIMQNSQPTQEAVDAHKESFRGDVSGT